MQFINARTQRLFFEAHRLRRRNRDLAMVEASIEHRIQLDDSLDMILCHHPDIWSKGTGVLLVAPNIQEQTESAKRAMFMRSEALSDHSYIRYAVQYEDEHIGFFIRKTIEFRERIRLYSYNSDLTGETLSSQVEEMIEYVENNITYEIENFCIQSERSRCIGIRKFGLDFDYHRCVTKYLQDYQIIDQIKAFYQIERVCDPLRNVLLNIFPNLLDNESVVRELSFEGYDSDVFSEISDYDINIPELVNSYGECVVCYNDGDVLEWPCHPSHIVCQKCTEKIFMRGALCPLCRKHFYTDFF